MCRTRARGSGLIVFNPARWQLKNKFVAIILLVLLIPLSSLFLLQEIEKGLVESLKQNLLLTSKLYGLQLESNSQWFAESNLPESEKFIAKELFVFPIQQDVVLDGFFEEWLFVENFRQEFRALDSQSDTDFIAVLLGSTKQHLYLSLQVFDSKVIYPTNNSKHKADQVVVSYVDENNIPQRVFISPHAPGKIPVKKFVNNQLKIDWRYTAYWIETSSGFNLEIKFPSAVKPKQLRVHHLDVDQTNLEQYPQVISTSFNDMNPMVWPSLNLSSFVNKLQVIPGQRIWIVDTKGRVLARQGSLQTSSDAFSKYNSFVSWMFSNTAETFKDKRGNRLRLNSFLIDEALTNKPVSHIEMSTGGHYAVALAASPIMDSNKAVGAILIEENVARVQLLQKQTLTQMFYVMFSIFVGIMFIVVWYVSKLVRRISLLKKQVNTIADEQGRMTAPLEIDINQGDEIDELNNAFRQMGNKLYEYHDYLEKLASRLSHELRTPIAIVRSSLDNLLLNTQTENDKAVIKRALDGTQRLGEIISRMRQASGVKEAMQSAHFEDVEINEFMGLMVEGFGASFPNYQFQLNRLKQDKVVKVSPDLLAELMDKLLSNAMDFCETGKPILIDLNSDKGKLEIKVINTGPVIEKKNLRKVFQSLVSIRSNKTSETPNLGLGLYVVKLIAEFHGAKVKADNLADRSGVVFRVIWAE